MHQQLKFSIDAILSPSFSTSSSPNCSDISSGSLTTSPVSSAAAVPSISSTPSLPSFDNRALFPPWVFCTRYSDRPSSGQRTRKPRKRENSTEEEKRPRTAFTADQLGRLKEEFRDNRYLTEKRRQELAHELRLNESQIKIWFQNKRAKLKKSTGERAPLSFAPFVAHSLYQRVLQP